MLPIVAFPMLLKHLTTAPSVDLARIGLWVARASAFETACLVIMASSSESVPAAAASTETQPAGVSAEDLRKYVDILSIRQAAIAKEGYGTPLGLGDDDVSKSAASPGGTPAKPRVQPTFIVEPSDPYDVAVGLGLAGPRDVDAARASQHADGGTSISQPPSTGARAAIRTVLSAQEERVGLFRQLDASIKVFEADSSPSQHAILQRKLSQLTPQFADVSSRIKQVAEQLQQEDKMHIAEHIHLLQRHEKEKWALTLRLLQSRVKLAVWTAAPGTAPAATDVPTPGVTAQMEEYDVQQRLRSALTGAVDAINESLDELRMAAAGGE